MAFYGPKTLDAKGDTVYYTLPESAVDFDEVHLDKGADGSGNVYFTAPWSKSSLTNDAFIAILLKPGLKGKLAGLLEYEKYKKEKIKEVPIMLINPDLFSLPDLDTSKPANNINYSRKYLKDSLGIEMDNFRLVFLNGLNFWNKEDNKFKYTEYNALYFNQKPEHVFDYFAVLVDKEQHIRGYYDPTFISEVKRMIEEYKHLVLKDEHADMQGTNKIEKK